MVEVAGRLADEMRYEADVLPDGSADDSGVTKLSTTYSVPNDNPFYARERHESFVPGRGWELERSVTPLEVSIISGVDLDQIVLSIKSDLLAN